MEEIYVDIELGDARKATSKLWAKELKRVDVTKDNGYAFEGRFLNREKSKAGYKYNKLDDTVPVGAFVVAVEEHGSWNYPGQDIVLYRATEDGLKEVYRNEWKASTKKEAIRAIAEIVNQSNVEEEILREQLRSLVEKYSKERILEILNEL